MTFQEFLQTRRPGLDPRGDLIREMQKSKIESEEDWARTIPTKGDPGT